MHCRSQTCWELLHLFAHHCQHARNNSQHCWCNNVGSCSARLHAAWNTIVHKNTLTFLCCQNENVHLLAHLQLVIHVVQNPGSKTAILESKGCIRTRKTRSSHHFEMELSFVCLLPVRPLLFDPHEHSREVKSFAFETRSFVFPWLLHLKSRNNVWKICRAARSKLATKEARRGAMFAFCFCCSGINTSSFRCCSRLQHRGQCRFTMNLPVKRCRLILN